MDELGLSQAELARRVGLSQPSIYALIHRNKTGSRSLHNIARELGTTPAYLSGETDDPDADAPEPSPLSHRQRELAELYAGLSPADQRALIQIARSMGQGGGAAETVHTDRQEFLGEGDDGRRSGREGSR